MLKLLFLLRILLLVPSKLKVNLMTLLGVSWFNVQFTPLHCNLCTLCELAFDGKDPKTTYTIGTHNIHASGPHWADPNNKILDFMTGSNDVQTKLQTVATVNSNAHPISIQKLIIDLQYRKFLLANWSIPLSLLKYHLILQFTSSCSQVQQQHFSNKSAEKVYWQFIKVLMVSLPGPLVSVLLVLMVSSSQRLKRLNPMVMPFLGVLVSFLAALL